MVSRGQAHHLEQLPGFVAIVNNRIIGIITYKIKNNYCEIVSLDSLDEKKGIGTKLVENVIEVARERLCKKYGLLQQTTIQMHSVFIRSVVL